MGRILKILLYLALLFFAYLWVATVFKSCNNDATGGPISTVVNAAEEGIDDITDAGSDLLDETEDFFDEEEEYEEVNYEALDTEEDYEDDDVYEEEDYSAPEKKESTPAPAPRRSTSVGIGNFFVITGSYLVESNAQEMRDKLSKLGYEAEVVIFDGSQYHAVISGRYASHEDAREDSRKLTGKGIDNFIQKKKL